MSHQPSENPAESEAIMGNVKIEMEEPPINVKSEFDLMPTFDRHYIFLTEGPTMDVDLHPATNSVHLKHESDPFTALPSVDTETKVRGRKQRFTEFRNDIAEQILELDSDRGRPSGIKIPTRQWAHFPDHIPSTGAKKNPSKRCAVCYNNGKRSETTWRCKKCNVALHLPQCFELYHTKLLF